MQNSRFALNDQSVPPTPVGAENQAPGFIPCPAFLWAGLTWEQMAWRHRVYQQAWAQAQASSQGVREFRASVADVPRAWRN